MNLSSRSLKTVSGGDDLNQASGKSGDLQARRPTYNSNIHDVYLAHRACIINDAVPVAAARHQPMTLNLC